jgi:hypothetical protein
MKQWILIGIILLIIAIGISYGFKGTRHPVPESGIELAGVWRGDLGGDPVVLTISPDLEVNLDIPEQGLAWIEVDRFSYHDDMVDFAVDEVAASFRGTVSGDQMSGTWTQNQVQRQLALRRRTTRTRSDSSLRSS